MTELIDPAACRLIRLIQPPSRKILLEFHREAGWQVTDKDLAKALQRGPHIQWVALEHDSHKIALARIELALPAFAYVSDLVVRQRHRGQGIGQLFIGQMETYSREKGADRVIVHPDPVAAGFWIKCGYQPDPKAQGFLKKEWAA